MYSKTHIISYQEQWSCVLRTGNRERIMSANQINLSPREGMLRPLTKSLHNCDGAHVLATFFIFPLTRVRLTCPFGGRESTERRWFRSVGQKRRSKDLCVSTARADCLIAVCHSNPDVLVAFSPSSEDFVRMFDNSFLACAFFFFFTFKVGIMSRTLIPLFRPGSVHRGSARWDECGRVFPDELRVSSFPYRFPHYAWTA